MMKNTYARYLFCLSCALFVVGAGAAQDTGATCEAQALQILDRLETEVVGKLSGEQRGAANEIVLDVCHQREAQVEAEVEAQVEEAVQEARKEEQEKSGGWFTNSGNKEGNKRLKRKQH